MTKTPPKIPSTFQMLMAAAAAAANNPDASRPPWPANPFPTGIRAGSITDKVLAELRRAAPHALTHGQLRTRCNAGRGAICWAVAYLANAGLIAKIPDSTRNHDAYLRYRAKEQP